MHLWQPIKRALHGKTVKFLNHIIINTSHHALNSDDSSYLVQEYLGGERRHFTSR